MLRTQVQLSETQARALKRLAAEQGVSIAELIRRGVDWVVRAGGVGEARDVRRRAAAISGRFHSGQGNLSTAHDEHLDDAYSS